MESLASAPERDLSDNPLPASILSASAHSGTFANLCHSSSADTYSILDNVACSLFAALCALISYSLLAFAAHWPDANLQWGSGQVIGIVPRDRRQKWNARTPNLKFLTRGPVLQSTNMWNTLGCVELDKGLNTSLCLNDSQALNTASSLLGKLPGQSITSTHFQKIQNTVQLCLSCLHHVMAWDLLKKICIRICCCSRSSSSAAVELSSRVDRRQKHFLIAYL